MNQENLAIIVLAAGKGTRMQQDIAKVLTSTCKYPLICHVLETAAGLSPEKCVVVTGYHEQAVKDCILNHQDKLYKFQKLSFVNQSEQLGTGHAALMAMPELKDFQGTVLILYGDTPLVKIETLKEFLKFHQEEKNTVSVLGLEDNNNAYGRLIKNLEGKLTKITELKDCSSREKQTKETNSGIYAVDSAFLGSALKNLENKNAQSEYYLTDIIEQAFKENQNVSALIIQDANQVQGVNTKNDLTLINQEIYRRKIQELISQGVNFLLPETCVIAPEAKIEADAEIGINTTILGNSKIERGVKIEGNAFIINSEIQSDTLIKFSSRIENSVIGKNCQIGPFAHLRPESKLGDNVKIGNFVESKKSVFHSGAKASHLSYIGDAEVGKNVNIGAGTITCNYDGKNKHKTNIQEEAFIGSNTALVAPVNIGKNALIGAGSVITKDVPENHLGLSRTEQRNIKKKP